MILVTGATGLVGARLTWELLKEGKQVRALIRKGSSTAAFDYWASQDQSQPDLQPEWAEGDLLDPDSLEIALVNVKRVFHCAGLISTDNNDAQKLEAINVRGTSNLVNLCTLIPEFEHFAHVSSVAALGRVEEESMFDENSHWTPGKHNSAYAISKYGGEREVWRAMAEGLPAVIINPSVIIGPGNWNQGSCRLFPMIAKSFPFYSTGSTGYVDVRDVTAILRLLSEKNISGERYLVSSENVSYRDLFFEMAYALKVQRPSIEITPWMAEVAWRLFAIKKAFTGKATLISKSYARTSQRQMNYNNQKVKKDLQFDFLPVKEAIHFTANAYLAQQA
jgi:dihydroflavonol-4-reductase